MIYFKNPKEEKWHRAHLGEVLCGAKLQPGYTALTFAPADAWCEECDDELRERGRSMAPPTPLPDPSDYKPRFRFADAR